MRLKLIQDGEYPVNFSPNNSIYKQGIKPASVYNFKRSLHYKHKTTTQRQTKTPFTRDRIRVVSTSSSVTLRSYLLLSLFLRTL